MPRTTIRAVLAATLAALALPAGMLVAVADPLPAPYRGSTSGLLLDVDLSGHGGDRSATVGASSTEVDSTAEQPSSATPARGRDVGRVPAVVTGGSVTGTSSTDWPGPASCSDGDPIAESTTTLTPSTVGTVTVEDRTVPVLHLGRVSTSGQTAIVDGSVVSVRNGSLAGAALLGDAVTIDVATAPEITARSDGRSGTVTANEYAVDVTIGDQDPVRLGAGDALPIKITVDDVLRTDLRLTVGTVDDRSSAAVGSGRMDFLTLRGKITNATTGDRLVKINTSVLPLSADATAPIGGVACNVLDAPAIDAISKPTTDRTPRITGTGAAGAVVTVADGKAKIGQSEVGNDGRWAVVPQKNLDHGTHRLTATQSLGETISPPSERSVLTVVEREPKVAPEPPVITSPEDGYVSDDGFIELTGTQAERGTVYVGLPADRGGPADSSLGDDGQWTWAYTNTDPLPAGEHTIEVWLESLDTLEMSERVSITITVVPALDTPTVDVPTDGGEVATPLPTYRGTGTPGNTILLSIDGNYLKDSRIDADGNWELRQDPEEMLEDGTHTLAVYERAADGAVSDVVELTFVQTWDITGVEPTISTELDKPLDPDSMVRGRGEPGARLTIAYGNEDDGDWFGITVSDNGRWKFRAGRIPCGQRQLVLTQNADFELPDGRTHTDVRWTDQIPMRVRCGGSSGSAETGTAANGATATSTTPALADAGSPTGLGGFGLLGLLVTVAGIGLLGIGRR